MGIIFGERRQAGLVTRIIGALDQLKTSLEQGNTIYHLRVRVCEYTVYRLFAIRLIFHLIVGLTNLGYLVISLALRGEDLVSLHIDLLKLSNAVLESLLHLNCLLF